MKSLKIALMLVALGFAAMGSAWADRGGGHGGHGYDHGGGHARIGIGIGFWDPWFYPPFYYPYYPSAYYPGTVVIEQPAPPMVYIEQARPLPPSARTAPGNQGNAQDNYWYYCPESRAYYPYVNDCPIAWQRVVPQPPAPR